MHNFRTRLIHGIGANSYSQLVSIAIQLLSLPIFLHHWTIEEYGLWILIYTVPAYFSMADLGIVAIAANRMTMLAATGKLREADLVFRSAQLFVVVACGVLSAGVVAAVLSGVFPTISLQQQGPAVLALTATALLNLASGLFEAVFRAAGQFAKGTFMLGNARLAEWAGVVVALQVDSSIFSAAAGGLVGRALASAYLFHRVRTGCVGFSWSLRDASTTELQRMVVPAVSFMAFPLGMAASMQGMLLIVGSTLGVAAVALFSTYRTLARLVVQLIGVGSHALGPEFSALYGRRDFPALRRTFDKGTRAGYLVSVVATLAVALVARPVLEFWSRGKVAFSAELLALALLSTLFAGAWHVSRVALLSMNEHIALSIVFLVACVFTTAAAYPLSATLGVPGAFMATVALELTMLIAGNWLGERFFARRALDVVRC